MPSLGVRRIRGALSVAHNDHNKQYYVFLNNSSECPGSHQHLALSTSFLQRLPPSFNVVAASEVFAITSRATEAMSEKEGNEDVSFHETWFSR